MPDLLIICPTRQRRTNLVRFLESFDATRRARTDLLVVVEEGDNSYDGVAMPDASLRVRTPAGCLTDKLNRHAVPLVKEYPAIGFFGDDCVFEAPGWDTEMLKQLETPGIAWPAGERQDYGEHEVISSVIIAALGWYFPPEMRHYWTDTALADLGRGAGCYRHAPGAIVSHRHKENGTDSTYELAESSGADDQLAYARWRGSRMAADIATVRRAIS